MDVTHHGRIGCLSCPGCGLELLVLERGVDVDDETRALIEREQMTVAYGPFEGARAVFADVGELFPCPGCSHPFLCVDLKTIHGSELSAN